jgi:Ser/Thr protein kinase RdoA (MazF antagonist)
VRACQDILGPVTVAAELSWPGSANRVVELRDAGDKRWIAKTVEPGLYQRELYAMRHWAPALGGAAPILRAADDKLRLLIMNRLPGRLVEGSAAEFDPAVHEQAGALIRQLHDAEPPAADTEVAAATAARLEDWIARGRHLLGLDEAQFARDQVRPLATAGPMQVVPAHMDNQPRNWMISDDGSVSIIDFGRCKRDVWIRDMQRLYFQQWLARPDLRDAFYAGYGRSPGEADLVLLRCYLVYGALTTVVWAHEHDDPGFEAHGRRMLAKLRAGHSPV